MISDFQQDGFIIVRNLFSTDEIQKIVHAIQNCDTFWSSKYDFHDKASRKYNAVAWTEPGDDVLGMAVKTVKVLQVAEKLLGKDEIYLYHGKVIMKEARTGGSLLWHQDYGYWYKNRCLFPDFVSSFVALTQNDKENGGLEVLKASHLCGRIEHGISASETAADEERVALLKTVLEHVYCNLKAGDAIFFHGNLLHSSQGNFSDVPRWNLILSFNARRNSPDKKHYSAQFTESLQPMSTNVLSQSKNPQIDPNRMFTDQSKNANIRLQS